MSYLALIKLDLIGLKNSNCLSLKSVQGFTNTSVLQIVNFKTIMVKVDLFLLAKFKPAVHVMWESVKIYIKNDDV